MIVAELELREIERQVLRADVMEGSHHATLQERPERFDVVGTDYASDVFASFMIDRPMGYASRSIWRFAAPFVASRSTLPETILRTNWSMMCGKVFSIILQVTLPLRLIASVTARSKLPSGECST